MSQYKKKLKEIIKTIDDLYLNTDIEDVAESSFLKDIGIDSLGKINLFYGIIDFYEIERDEEIVTSWKTLQDVLSFIEEL